MTEGTLARRLKWKRVSVMNVSMNLMVKGILIILQVIYLLYISDIFMNLTFGIIFMLAIITNFIEDSKKFLRITKCTLNLAYFYYQLI